MIFSGIEFVDRAQLDRALAERDALVVRVDSLHRSMLLGSEASAKLREEALTYRRERDEARRCVVELRTYIESIRHWIRNGRFDLAVSAVATALHDDSACECCGGTGLMPTNSNIPGYPCAVCRGTGKRNGA